MNYRDYRAKCNGLKDEGSRLKDEVKYAQRMLHYKHNEENTTSEIRSDLISKKGLYNKLVILFS